MTSIVSRNDTDHVLLLENGTETGAAKDWPGGPGALMVEGTFGGTEAKLQVKSPRGTWLDVGSDTTLTAPGVAGFDLPGADIRILLSGGTPTAMYVYARRLAHRGG